MLVPLTDPQNPYSKMMLDLIADQTPYPSSPWPRQFTEVVEPTISRGRVAGAIVVGLGVVVVIGAVAARTLAS